MICENIFLIRQREAYEQLETDAKGRKISKKMFR